MNYFEENIKIIDKSISLIDNKVFEKLLMECNETLNKGNKIIVSGLGKNVPICEKFMGSMISLGMNAYFLHTNSAVHGDLGLIKPNDLVIILTKSGETVESVYLTDLIQKMDNVDIWLMSFNKKSTLTKKIKKTFIMSLDHEGDMWNILPNNSTVVNLIVLQELAMQLAKMRNIPISELRKNHPGGNIGKLLG